MNEILQTASSGCLPVKPAVSPTKRVIQAADVALGVGYLLGGAFLLSTGGWFLVAAGVSLVAVGLFRLVANAYDPKRFTSTSMMLAGTVGIIASVSTAGIPFLVVGCVLLGLGLLRKLGVLGSLTQTYFGLCAWYNEQKRKTLEQQAQKSLEVFTNALVNFEVKQFGVKDELSIYQLIAWIGSCRQVADWMYKKCKGPKIQIVVEQMARLHTDLCNAKNRETVLKILDDLSNEQYSLELFAMLGLNAQFRALAMSIEETVSSEKPEFLQFAVPAAPADSEEEPASPPQVPRSHHPLYRNEIHQMTTQFNNRFTPTVVPLAYALYAGSSLEQDVQKITPLIKTFL